MYRSKVLRGGPGFSVKSNIKRESKSRLCKASSPQKKTLSMSQSQEGESEYCSSLWTGRYSDIDFWYTRCFQEWGVVPSPDSEYNTSIRLGQVGIRLGPYIRIKRVSVVYPKRLGYYKGMRVHKRSKQKTVSKRCFRIAKTNEIENQSTILQYFL